MLSQFRRPAAAAAVFAVATLAVVLPAATARAQAATGLKIGVVNAAMVFDQMQETKDLKVKLTADQQNFTTETKNKRDRLTEMQTGMSLYKPTSPEFADAKKKLVQAAVDFEVWNKMQQEEQQQNQKAQLKALFDKMTDAVAEVGKNRGLDLVVADQRPPLDNMDQLTVQQVQMSLSSRNVLYAGEKLDISQDVIATLDQKYKASGATPTPAALPSLPGMGK